MSGISLSTKVLEAGGSIESRCINPPLFTERYVFTKEQLEAGKLPVDFDYYIREVEKLCLSLK